MDVISACAYGIDIDSINNPDHPIVSNAKKILNVDASISVLLSVLVPPLARFLNLEPFDINAANYFDYLTNKLVEERKKLADSEGIKSQSKIELKKI
jgi:cytochrome P450 family 3 subfamily A